ncbi:MAG: alpha/beta hydrolase [Paracoccaceae bacterium]|nr:alpha/beta hydrolase [Paracoccaceae bacterium]
MTPVVYGTVGLLALLAAWPFLAEWARPAMTPARQAKAPGEIAHLPGGATHYRWSGREGDPVVVCIHGLSTPSYVFAATVRSLTSLGYRVLSYDLYGRGYSARVRGTQDMAFFLSQLQALLKHQNVEGPLIVLGFSMGGQIAAAFAAREDRVEKLIIVASAGLAHAETTGQTRVWTAPVIGDWMTRIWGGIALRRELVDHKTVATVIPDLEDRQAAETRMRGFLPAILSSRRHLLQRSSLSDHTQIARVKVAVLAIWGTADPVIPRRALSALAEVNPDARHVEVAGAGHNLLQTHPSEIATALKAFLNGA